MSFEIFIKALTLIRLSPGVPDMDDESRYRLCYFPRPDASLILELHKDRKVCTLRTDTRRLPNGLHSAQCGQVNIVVSNGTSPFRLEIIPEDVRFISYRLNRYLTLTHLSQHIQKTLHFTTNRFVRHVIFQIG